MSELVEAASAVLGSYGMINHGTAVRDVENLRRAIEAEKTRLDRFKTALVTITAILDEVESDRLERNVDIDVDELIAAVRKQLRNAWGL